MANGPSMSRSRSMDLIYSDGTCVNFQRLKNLVYWLYNHHMIFSRALASLARYRESFSDRSPIFSLFQIQAHLILEF